MFKLLALVAGCLSAPLDFVPKVIRCPVNNQAAADALESMESLDIWSHGLAIGNLADIHVSTSRELEEVLAALGLEDETACSIKIKDLNSLLGSASRMRSAPLTDLSDESYFKDYQVYANIVAKVEEWVTSYPNLITYYKSIGSSVEGRAIPAFKITDPSATGLKRAIFWNGGQHAREWYNLALIRGLRQAPSCTLLASFWLPIQMETQTFNLG